MTESAAAPGRPAPPPPRRTEGGFSLTELMVVVLILGLTAAIATPVMRRDARSRVAKDFAASVARSLQRARVQAIAERLPVRAFVYRDRVEFRSARPGATPGAVPIAPTVADPILRVVTTGPEASIWNVLTTSATPPPAQTLTTAAAVEIEFNVLGQAQFVGQPALTGAFIYLRHALLPAGNPDRDLRIDVNALTGFVGLRETWQ